MRQHLDTKCTPPSPIQAQNEAILQKAENAGDPKITEELQAQCSQLQEEVCELKAKLKATEATS